MNTPNESKRPSDASIAKAVRNAVNVLTGSPCRDVSIDLLMKWAEEAELDRSEPEQRETLDAAQPAQPAQAGEAVYQVKFRMPGTGWLEVDRESYEGRGMYALENYDRRVLFSNPQPEQPASAVSPAAYCDASDPRPERAFSWPGTARNPRHETPLYLRAQSPAVSPPSVVAADHRVWALVEEAERSGAVKDEDDAGLFWTLRLSDFVALESFAQRMGSGERDAVDELLTADIAFDAAEDAWREAIVNATGDESAGALGKEADRLWQAFGEAARRRKAAIAQQNKRGGA